MACGLALASFDAHDKHECSANGRIGMQRYYCELCPNECQPVFERREAKEKHVRRDHLLSSSQW